VPSLKEKQERESEMLVMKGIESKRMLNMGMLSLRRVLAPWS